MTEWVKMDCGIYGVSHEKDDDEYLRDYYLVSFISGASGEKYTISHDFIKVIDKEKLLVDVGCTSDIYDDDIIYKMNRYSGLQYFLFKRTICDPRILWELQAVHKLKKGTPIGINEDSYTHFYYNNIDIGSNAHDAFERARELGWTDE